MGLFIPYPESLHKTEGTNLNNLKTSMTYYNGKYTLFQLSTGETTKKTENLFKREMKNPVHKHRSRHSMYYPEDFYTERRASSGRLTARSL